MPNPSKGARLYLRAAAGSRKAVWVIRDGTSVVSTGCPHGERDAAEQRLAAYIADKHRPSREGGRHPSQIEIADVLSIYLADHETKVARPRELGQRLTSLGRFFGLMKLDRVNGKLCRSYVKHRKSPAAARRELEDLRAAINHHRREGLCSEVIEVALPEKSQPRDRWMTRDEAARLLWAAWGWTLVPACDARTREERMVVWGRSRQDKRKHVARFILVGLYTGTRATAICQAAMRPTIGRGYVDLGRGVFYRKAAGQRETKKRQPPTSLNPRLLAHLRRWDRIGVSREAVVEWKGAAVARMAKGFRNAAVDARLGGVMPHVLRHTAITWAMQNGADRWEACGMFGVTMDVLERVYAHHRPDHGASVHRAINVKSAQPVRQPVRGG